MNRRQFARTALVGTGVLGVGAVVFLNSTPSAVTSSEFDPLTPSTTATDD
ncbi:MAG: hypothetical protein J07HB67_01615, partial [halophilic archaeon J07HB67]